MKTISLEAGELGVIKDLIDTTQCLSGPMPGAPGLFNMLVRYNQDKCMNSSSRAKAALSLARKLYPEWHERLMKIRKDNARGRSREKGDVQDMVAEGRPV